MLYKQNEYIGCDAILINPNETTFPKKIIRKQTIFLDQFAETVEFQKTNLIFFAKYSNFYKLYELTPFFTNPNYFPEDQLMIKFTPFNFYQLKYSNDLILLFQKPYINQNFQILSFQAFDYKAHFLNSFDVVLKKNNKLELLDVFNKKLFLKQFHDELIVINLMNGEYFESKGFTTPQSIDFWVNEKNKEFILCFYSFGVQLWDFSARKVSSVHFNLCSELEFSIEITYGMFFWKNKNIILLYDLNNLKDKKEIECEEKSELLLSNQGNLFILEGNRKILREITFFKRYMK